MNAELQAVVCSRQVPRLTTMLRTFMTDRGALDVDAHTLKRAAEVQRRDRTKAQVKPVVHV